MSPKQLMKRAVTIAAGGNTKEIAQMNHTHTFVTTSIVLAGIIVSGVAFAQEPTPPKPSTATQVETWTKKQWGAAKKEWAKDKAKWADCRKQSREQKLKGRKSWSFLYTCMKS